MTKKELKNKINQLEDDMRNLQSYTNIKGYVELSRQIQKMKIEYDMTIQPTINKMYNELNNLKREYSKPVKEKLVVPTHLQKWLRNWMSGVSFGYNTPYIRWISPDEKYVVITTPGGTAGQGTPQGTGGYYYASSSHYLIRAVEGANWFERSGHGEKTKIAQHEGRLTKDKMNEWLELIKTL
jgi:hypothetical protein